jgi:hypothetical protein
MENRGILERHFSGAGSAIGRCFVFLARERSPHSIPKIGSDPDDICAFGLGSEKIPDLRSRSVINLTAVEKGNHHVGIMEVGFAAGENLCLSLCAKGSDLFLSYQIIRENDFDP